ncbi:AAA family ATPase [Trichlorobacter ammonificans]|uniref:ATPase n=1 Tax=Trichlorobacter ammonificans TaxID=2916410 RepID=A0ABM9D469_9BACT|nr:MoxR family ATPase [Trichlorobacter ammonificans]CAH2030044.1 ATPase [Trichlorobacter ammonificans]
MRQTTIDTITLSLAGPVELPLNWIGQEELLQQLLAAWMVIDERDIPFNPRLVGKPGVGKTTLAYAAARRLGRPVYLFQATMDTRPEDLIVTPVIGPGGAIQYAASSLVSAMLAGGVLILDEGNRMSEKSWASLAPLLDDRRYVESVITGLRIPAHRDFRIVVTMNEDASTFELPEYIHSRLQPQLFIDFPEADEELLILRENLPFADDAILRYVVQFLQKAHDRDELYSVRDGINIARYALKMATANGSSPADLLPLAVERVLGDEALRYLS